MYAPRYAPGGNQASETQASETQATAMDSDRRQMDQGEARYGFRPLALPALAAAARPRPPASKARTGHGAGRQGILGIVHEDAPLD